MPSSPGRPSKAERLEQQRRARRRRRLRNRALGLLLVVLALTGIVLKVGADRRRSQRLLASLTTGSCRVDSRSDEGRDHVANPTYRVDPPAGGEHDGRGATPAGLYREEAEAPLGQVVHALEHGYVVLWAQPSLGEDQLQQLEAIWARHERDTLVVRRSSLPVPVAATAWGRRLLCERVEADPLSRFVTAFANKGPEKIPHE